MLLADRHDVISQQLGGRSNEEVVSHNRREEYAQGKPVSFRKDFGNRTDTDTKTTLDLSNTEFNPQVLIILFGIPLPRQKGSRLAVRKINSEEGFWNLNTDSGKSKNCSRSNQNRCSR